MPIDFPIHTEMPDIETLRKLFNRVDKDKNGLITANELQSALSNGTFTMYKAPFNPEAVRLLIVMFDEQNRGGVTFDDFGALWKYITRWEKCYKIFDRDFSENINRQELELALGTFGYCLSPKLIDLILQKFDRLGKGTILFEDFVQCCISIHNLTDAFNNYDTDRDDEIIIIPYERFISLALGLKM